MSEKTIRAEAKYRKVAEEFVQDHGYMDPQDSDYWDAVIELENLLLREWDAGKQEAARDER